MTAIFSFVCSCCGKVHDGSPSFAFNAPAPYLEQPDEIREKGKLGSDLCTYEDEDGVHYFIRVILEIPIHGIQEPFTWGVWASVSEKSFHHYVETYDKPSLEYGYFGYLSNYLPFYKNTYALASDMHVQLGGSRPKMALHDVEHPLVSDFVNGISVQKAQEIAEFCTHSNQ
ncbi:DUF2199 domain-containing protein [Permianibacter sp. IMCC34836]|uniref:DUF2199 domain-containing protein n=1 Tax=Permianibacter fluminis TaxID=2738515 RepID=UPI001557024F|nr:DUF2199 domain-containing protein [Permianibacter fluminis]NQD36119.1 DUF2199 domain-containing protein [Permianibacter fluminis]